MPRMDMRDLRTNGIQVSPEEEKTLRRWANWNWVPVTPTRKPKKVNLAKKSSPAAKRSWIRRVMLIVGLLSVTMLLIGFLLGFYF